MTTLANYDAFAGRHWETGSVQNYYQSRGVVAPHTGKPFSEAFLMGVSGGAVMGYFTFAYEGYDPMARILTRNTFDPFERMLERLGVIQNLIHTNKPDRAQKLLLETLDEGEAALVWTDIFSLPYNALPWDDANWGVFPLVVYGYEPGGSVSIADRSTVGLMVEATTFDGARSRLKKFKHRMLTLSPPNEEKLITAVSNGIWDCIKLYLEAPPKGSKNNFGLAAYQYMAQMLTKPKQKRSWEKEFPAGRKQYAALTSMYHDIVLFGKDMNGRSDRDLYADFLDEAAVLLQKDALTAVAEQFRQSAAAWGKLAEMLLPDDIPSFKETRETMLRQHQLFLTEGNTSLDERVAINHRLEALKVEMENDFPLDESGVVALRESLAEQLLVIHDIERDAVLALQSVQSEPHHHSSLPA